MNNIAWLSGKVNASLRKYAINSLNDILKTHIIDKKSIL